MREFLILSFLVPVALGVVLPSGSAVADTWTGVLRLDENNEEICAEIGVTNTGDRQGFAVLEVYAGWAEPHSDQPRKRLCGFARVCLAPGSSERVSVNVALQDLAHFDPAVRHWTLGRSDWRLWLGASSAEEDLVPVDLTLSVRTWPIKAG